MIHIDPDSRTLVFSPSGDLDGSRAEGYRHALLAALNEDLRQVTFDFRTTRHISSVALGLLAEIWNLAGTKGIRLEVVSASEAIDLLLQHTRLDRLLNCVSPSEADHLCALNGVNATMAAELRILDRLNRALVEVLQLSDPAQVPKRMLAEILAALGSTRGAFFAWETKTENLELDHWTGEEARPSMVIWAAKGSPEREALDGGGPRYVHGESEAHQNSALLKTLGFGSAILAPMHGGERAMGLFAIEASPENEALFFSMAPLVDTFATIGSLVGQKVNLLKTLEERNQRLEEAMRDLGQVQVALNDSSKLATLGALVSGLSHAFNNRLVPILGYSQLLAKRFAGDEKTARQIATLEDAAKDLKRMLDRLWMITRGRPPAFAETDLNETIESALLLAEPLLKERRVGFERDLAEDLPGLPLDRELMVQAFLSICHRVQFLYAAEEAKKTIWVYTGQEDGSVAVEFAAPGVEVSEDLLATMQDPLAPLQRIGNEDVFNLSIPASVVRKHGGEFEVCSSPEIGLKISIRLPLAPRRLNAGRQVG